MLALRLMSLATILIFSSSAFAQRWAPYTSEDGEFRIMVPGGQFEVETVDFETEYGIVVPARVHTAQDTHGNYTLTVVDYRDSMELHRVRIEELDGVYLGVYGEVDVRGSVAYFARMIRERAESVEYDNYHYIGRVDGHQLHTTNPDGTRTFAALYLLEKQALRNRRYDQSGRTHRRDVPAVVRVHRRKRQHDHVPDLPRSAQGQARQRVAAGPLIAVWEPRTVESGASYAA